MAITIAILGDKANCSKTSRLHSNAGNQLVAKLKALLPNTIPIDADKNENPAAYAKYRPRLPFSFVTIRGLDESDKEVFKFVVNGSQTPPKLADMIVARCKECAEGGTVLPVTPPVTPPVTNPSTSCTCPNCGKALKITLALLALVALTGCTATTVTVKDKDWAVKRFSVLQKVANQRIAINGVGTMEGYDNDGGSDIMRTVIDAAIRVGQTKVPITTPFDEPTIVE